MERFMQVARLVTAKRYRRWLAVGVLVITSALVVHFLLTHPEYLARLRTVSPWVIVGVIALNIPTMAALAWAYDILLRICGKPLAVKENVLLTAYSSIINFFGPLQSGPGVRAFYLKTRHKVRIRDYVLATLMYYALFAVSSAFFLLAGMRPWWQTVLAIGGAGGFSALVIRWFAKRNSRQASTNNQQLRLRPHLLALLALAVLFQLVCIAAYYYVELKAVNPSISISQAISYSGAANFALFVSITPDAVGFREAFLIFSQSIHHVATADIVNANVIDRGAYVLYLGLLFVVVLSVHARDQLHLQNWRTATAEEDKVTN